MLLFFTSFIAGVLTVLAPCVLPLLPVIIGSSAESRSQWHPVILISSLAVSVVIFTLLLRATTAFITVPQSFWTGVSGGILILFGIITLFPGLWYKINGKLSGSSQTLLQKSSQKEGITKPIMMGAALGPVFTSCSPTYALLLATVLPASFITGVFYIIVYVIGMCLVLGLIAVFGQAIVQKFRSATSGGKTLKKVVGGILIVVGLGIMMGWDKDVEAWIIEQGYFGQTQFEEDLVKELKKDLK